MKILGIETSCDETGVAIYDEEKGLIANQLYSQIEMHADYGGVVPELASRDHIRKTVPLIEAALKEANLTACDIDGVAYTAGPGLVGALLVGATIACLCVECPRIGRASYGRASTRPNVRRNSTRVSFCGTAYFRWAYAISESGWRGAI